MHSTSPSLHTRIRWYAPHNVATVSVPQRHKALFSGKTHMIPVRIQPLPTKTSVLPSLGALTSPERLSRLYNIVRSLNSIVTQDKLLDRIVASATEMIDTRGGALLLTDATGLQLTFEVIMGAAPSSLKGVTLPVDGGSIAGVVAMRGKPHMDNNVQQSTYFRGRTDKQTGYIAQKMVGVPLKVQNRTIGVLEVFDKVGGFDFNREDMKLLEALADVAAVAIENVRLYEETNRRAQQLEEAYGELQRTSQGTLQALIGLLDARDSATRGHSNRVVGYTLKLADVYGIKDKAELRALEQGALLHDVGKIGVADAILHKPGPLDEGEWSQMRAHPELGYRMLKDIEFLKDALPIVRYHHERWDGSGYPKGLRGMAIPLGARIFAVIDAFDAITSERAYKPARAYEEAAAILQADADKAFDPTVVVAFLKVPKEVWERIRLSEENQVGLIT